ncbi:unnamed protein product [Polarella glacialis]|uniref:PARP n=1 Tax=Polarella glacialis TaxID=89957 RepID=A0A813JGD9_POLGL|nr:unnamed protein product [Polarella glacialis]
MSLMDSLGETWAKPWQLGAHRIVHPTASRKVEGSHGSEACESLDGRMEDVWDAEDEREHEHDFFVQTAGLGLDTAVVGSPQVGSLVQVVQTAFLEHCQVLRARVGGSGWITVEDTGRSLRFTAPVQPLGLHRLVPRGTQPQPQAQAVPLPGNKSSHSEDSCDEAVPVFASEESSLPELVPLPAGSIVKVIEVNLDATAHSSWRIMGRLEESGWIILEDAAGRQLSQPLRAGAYRLLVKSSAAGTGLEKLVQVEALMSSDGAVTAKLDDGSCLDVSESTDGHLREFALPVQLGVYRVEAAFAEVFMSARPGVSRREDTEPQLQLGRGTFFQIVETLVLSPGYVWGRLVGGGWLLLQDAESGTTGTFFATALPTGAYTAATTTAIFASDSLEAEVVTGILPGESLEIVETCLADAGPDSPEEKMAWGRVIQGGWLPLEDPKTGCCWAWPRQLGAWRVIAEGADVTAGPSPHSKHLGVIPMGTFVQLVQARFLEREKCLRGQSAHGGWWVSLELPGKGFSCAEALRLGACVVVDGSAQPVLAAPRESDQVGLLDPGSLIQVVEVRAILAFQFPDDNRISQAAADAANGSRLEGVWARLDRGGWFLLASSSEPLLHSAEPLPIGAYRIGAWPLDLRSKSRAQLKQIEPQSAAAVLEQKLLPGACVEVRQVHFAEEVGFIQAQLECGNWLDTVDFSHGADLAAPLALGIYRTEMPCNVYSEPFQSSTVLCSLKCGAFVKVAVARMRRSHRLLWAKLPSGGWMPLEDTNHSTPESGLQWARPVQLGAWLTTESVEVTETAFGEKVLAWLTIGSFVQILELVTSEDQEKSEHTQQALRTCQTLRGRTHQGWIHLETTGSHARRRGEAVALGAHRVLSKALQVFSEPQSLAEPIAVVQIGAIIEVVEVCLLQVSLWARLSIGGWVHIADSVTGYSWAEPVPLGAYKVLSHSVPVLASDRASDPLRWLQAGTIVQVLQTKFARQTGCVWARMDGGGWLVLEELSRGFQGQAAASPVRVGVYKVVVDSVSISSCHGFGSGTIGEAVLGTFVEVTETILLVEETVLRGKLAGGGWISLFDPKFSTCWAEPLVLGMYKTIAEATSICKVPDEISESRQSLDRGTYLQIVQVVLDAHAGLVFGQLEDGAWIPLESVRYSLRWAVPVPLGAYEITEATDVFEALGMQSRLEDSLPANTVVQVIEVVHLAELQLLRARLEGNIWISLEDTSTGSPSGRRPWAKPFPSGAYEICTDGLAVCAGEDMGSEVLRVVNIGEHVQVLETKVLETDAKDYVRARLSGGGWLTIFDDELCAEPVPVGAYVVVAEAVKVWSDPRPPAQGLSSSKLQLGAHVQVEEVLFIASDHSLQARLSGGDWLAMLDTRSGHQAVRPVQTGAYRVSTRQYEKGSAPPLLRDETSDVLIPDALIQVEEVFFSQEEQLLRARLHTGSWVSLQDASTGRKRAEPIPTGAYLSGEGKEQVRFLVTQLRVSPGHGGVPGQEEKEEGHLQGRLQSDGSWISLEDFIGKCFAKEERFKMYHGTTEELANKILRTKLIPPVSGGSLGSGVYLSRTIERAHENGAHVVLEVSVNLGRVKRIGYRNHALQKTWSRQGYDSAWVPAGSKINITDLEEDCVYDPLRLQVIQRVQVKEKHKEVQPDPKPTRAPKYYSHPADSVLFSPRRVSRPTVSL